MNKTLLFALLASSLALPSTAQPTWRLGGVLIEPRHPTTSDRIRLTVVGEGQCNELKPVYDEATGSVVVGRELLDCISAPFYPPVRETFEIGPLPAGQHFVEMPWGDDSPVFMWREIFEVTQDAQHLDLGEDGHLHVRVHWSNPRDGSSGWANARQLARDSGAFWFFTPDNLEVTVKILDGRAINGRWWVFIASMTDLQFEVEAWRTGGPVTTYVQNAGMNRNFIDTDATFDGPPQPVSDPFLTAPEIVLDPEHPTSADPVYIQAAVLGNASVLDFVGREGNSFIFNHGQTEPLPGHPEPPLQPLVGGTTAGPLAPGVYRVEVNNSGSYDFGRTFEVTEASPILRLGDAAGGHFDIEVAYRLPGETDFRTARGVPVTRNAGYFYFFDRENAEVTFKVLDGRGVNRNWWVFLANMTTVELEIKVTHCPSQAPPAYCITKTYVQPPGQNRNFLDTTTFFGAL